MSFKYLVCGVLLALFNNSLGEEPELPTLTNCGDTLNGNGVIRYKVNQSYDNHEWCTFIVRTDHGGYTFTLRSHGIDENTDKNAINIFTYGENGQVDSVHMGPPNPSTTAYVVGGLAVILFRTEGSSGTGFELEFKGTGPYRKDHSRPGVQMVFNSSVGNLTAPAMSWPDFGERMTTNIFVIQHPKRFNHLNIVRIRLYDEYLYTYSWSWEAPYSCPNHRVLIYSFSDGSTREQGEFCNELHHRTVYDSDGMFIVLFSRYYIFNSPNDHRFSMAWRNCVQTVDC